MAGWMVGAALALLVAQAAEPPAPAPDKDAPATVEDVVVTGPRAKAISDFVQAISEPTKERRLSRWNRTICPATMGLPRKYGEFLNDRLAQVARSVGLEVDKPGCRPDILIVVADDVDLLMTELETAHQAALAVRPYSDDNLSSAGTKAFGEFLHEKRPVRWWHVSTTTPSGGQPVSHVRNGGMIIRGVSDSRLKSTVQEEFAGVLVVVDAKMAQGVSYDALSSYLAMVSLAQLDPHAQTSGSPTILNLFSERAAGQPGPSGLTDWDQAYLQGLYGARADAPNLRSQRSSITRRLKRGGDEAPAKGDKR
ncbi:hypothetical protein [Caulobacter sp. 17J65-9]|uniref:hypothetical protein n=1 Tax=Caulobacter sp. 17J65-9 TaxID=2709382 RepID=UPI0013C6DBEF|nr:hypothetical protein [Caulobacter sp. 17J65-9]NEX94378.1 hypothetical protein [Caulobacter sp. 17J65-9]